MVDLTRVTGMGMVAVRGDLSAIGAVLGARPAPLTFVDVDDLTVAWMSPDEVLVLCPTSAVPDLLARLASGLAGRHHLAVDLSDARAMFRLAGAGASEVLAKLTPVDMAPAAFPPGTFRRSKLGQIAAAMWRDEQGFGVVCFRSVGDYAEALLRQSAADGAVGHH
jgi:sarcosine oxidase, subunit gamma